jgi:hypothetical protein
MAFTLLASICLAVGYLHDRQAALALALLVLGLLWVLAQWRGWDWASGLGLAATAGVAAAGAWLGLPPGWMIAAAVAALLAWDLAGFRRRLALAAPTDDLPALTHRHLASAGLVAGIGVLLAAAATLVELRFPLGWTMLLALAAALGTARLVGWLRA